MKKGFNDIICAIYILVLCAFVSTGCSSTKGIPENDKLYTGASVSSKQKDVPGKILNELEHETRPLPNADIFGFEYRLHIFNLFKESGNDSGLVHKLKYKWGEQPVLLSSVNMQAMERKMNALVFSKGWLRPSVSYTVKTKGRKASVNYEITPGTRYKIRQVYFPNDSTGIAAKIREAENNTLLKPGGFIDLETFKAETQRIGFALKEQGYYFFEPENILIKVDSLHSGNADLYVTVKKETGFNASHPWKLGEIVIYSNYSLERDSIIKKQKGEKYKYFRQIDRIHNYRPWVFDKAIELRKDSLYTRQKHSLTIERLMNLGTFKFVRLAFIPDSTSTEQVLNTRIYLTPAVRQSLRLEFSGNAKSNNYVGTDVSLKYRNVNVGKGAEIFEINITGGFDWQIGGRQLSPNAQLFNAEANLYIPKLIPYFPVNIQNNPFIPRTVFSASVEYLRKPGLYLLNSSRFSAGYNWKEGKAIEHNIRLININSIFPSNVSPEFEAILKDDINLRNAFEKQLVIGSKYQFQYNNTYQTARKFNIVFIGSLSLSGNLASRFIKADGDTSGSKKIFNIPLSQYSKVEADLRTFWTISPRWLLVNRFNAGGAFGYGNSSTVPYVEQFFIGGSSSMRAFRVRTLGPGSFRTDKAVYQANESGEIKIETNAELRYKMNSFINLAAFIDAGNIFLRKEAPDKPGSGMDNFMSKLAVGGGIGLRIDASVLVLRFDAALPFRKPWNPQGQRWVFNEIAPWDSTWRKENLILNVGIGYPF